MVANFLIGLREGLEAALIVSILVAYLVKSGRRSLLPQIWAGVGIAVAISLAFGAVLTFGPKGLTFEAKEMIGGGLSIIAVGFVTWMIFWMARSARNLSGVLRGRIDAADGKSLSLVIVAILAVGREGLETALFLWAATLSAGRTGSGNIAPLAAALVGLVAAAALGWLIYRGAVKINLSKFFAWTGGFLILVAAGVLAYGLHDLQEAGVLPGLNSLAFDVSNVIAPGSVLGTVLKGIFNFSPATTWLEAFAWVGYVTVVGAAFVRAIRRPPTPSASTSTHTTQTATSRTPQTAFTESH